MTRARRVPVPVALAVAILSVALLLALSTAIRMPVLVSLDEAVYKLSAAHYAADGPGAIRGDEVARGVAWLYSVLLAPVFALFSGDVAIRVARGLGTLVFALAAVPVFALARRVMDERRAAVAAVLSIVVPWATISTVLFSEVLAYPLFAAAAWAMARALRAPSPARDALVVGLCVALILTRIQFVAVPLAWLVLVVGFGGVRADRRTALRRFPVTLGLAASGVLVAVVALVTGELVDLVQSVGGPYAAARDEPPRGLPTAAVFEVAMLALGTGLVPLVLALPWWRGALGRRLGDEAFRQAALALALVVAVFGIALLGQNGWQGPDVAEERYYVYAVPFVFVAALGGLGLPRLRTATLAGGALVVLVLLALAPTTAGLSSERAFLVPVAASAANVASRVGANQHLLVVLVGVAVLGAAFLAARHARWAMLVPAVALQLAIGLYALSAMHGAVPGVPGATTGPPFAQLGWVDRATPGGEKVSVVADATTSRLGDDLSLTFWNDEAQRTTHVLESAPGAQPFPVSALPSEWLTVGTDLAVTPAPVTRDVVVTPDSAYVQLAGRRIAAGRGRALVTLDRPARARWVSRGVGPDGGLPRPVTLTAAPGQRIELVVLAPAGTPGGEVVVTLGEQDDDTRVDGSETTTLGFDTCGADGPVQGTLRQTEAASGGTATLAAVRLTDC